MYENLPQKASTYRGRILLSREIRENLPIGKEEVRAVPRGLVGFVTVFFTRCHQNWALAAVLIRYPSTYTHAIAPVFPVPPESKHSAASTPFPHALPPLNDHPQLGGEQTAGYNDTRTRRARRGDGRWAACPRRRSPRPPASPCGAMWLRARTSHTRCLTR